MTDPLQVNAVEAFNTTHTLANHAEELRDGENLSHGWEGVAAAAYVPVWD